MFYNWNVDVAKTREELGDSLVNVLTFQSRDVLDFILSGGTYLVDPEKCREKRDYRPDCREGLYPIYVICPLEFGNGCTSFILEDLLCGSFLFRESNEMSIDREELSKRPLLEISVPASKLFKATVHNAASEVYITHKIEPCQLVRWYDVVWGSELKDGDDWFYPTITVHEDSEVKGPYKSSEEYEKKCQVFTDKPVHFSW